MYFCKNSIEATDEILESVLSKDTAIQDIQALIPMDILRKAGDGGRSVNYELM